MYRRSCLASIPSAATLGGCLSDDDDYREYALEDVAVVAPPEPLELEVREPRYEDGQPKANSASPDGDAHLVLELMNPAAEPVTLETSPFPPFGVVYALGRRGGFPLCHDAYEASNGIDADGEDGPVETGDPATVTLAPNDAIERACRLRHDDVAQGPETGTYTATGESVVSRADADRTTVWVVRFDVLKRERY